MEICVGNLSKAELLKNRNTLKKNLIARSGKFAYADSTYVTGNISDTILDFCKMIGGSILVIMLGPTNALEVCRLLPIK
jgi:hypothetical protein